MLGNAVVPMVAMVAFARLFSGFRVNTLSQLQQGPVMYMEISKASDSIPFTSKIKHGSFLKFNDNADFVVEHEVAIIIHAKMRIELNPKHYVTSRVYQENSGRNPLPSLKSSIVKDKWPTPRKMAATHSYALTSRTKNDLPTVAMFASKVQGKALPRTKDGQGINPRFVEWLMGFPLDHTKY